MNDELNLWNPPGVEDWCRVELDLSPLKRNRRSKFQNEAETEFSGIFRELL